MYTNRVKKFVLILVFATTICAWAQSGYEIGPGDELRISVYDEPDLERVVSVQSDGTIRFPLVRVFKVGGLTVQEAEKALEEALGAQFLVDPQVTIEVKEYKAHTVYVLGSVRKPGFFALTGPTTVLEVISKAGGLSEDGSRRILLMRGSADPARLRQMIEQSGAQAGEEELRRAGLEPPEIIDGRKLIDEGDTSQNRLLKSGDVLYIPKLKKVYVLGEVARPGGVPYDEGLTLLQAVSLAGGTTQMAANTITVTRKVDGQEKRFKLKLKAIMSDTSKDLVLEPDDVIVIKRRWL